MGARLLSHTRNRLIKAEELKLNLATTKTGRVYIIFIHVICHVQLYFCLVVKTPGEEQ